MSKETWEKEIPSEVSFWKNWIETHGNKWKEEYKTRIDPNSKLQSIFLPYLDKTLKVNRILDVGAGPLTIINKKCEFTELSINAIDPLADSYNGLLMKHGIQPIIKTEKCDGENLCEKFSENSFDITYSRNALDHSYDPYKCIVEMIKVTRKNKYIIFQVFENEANRRLWQGLHKWNFFIKRKFLIIKQPGLWLRGKNTNQDLGTSLSGLAKFIRVDLKGKEITAVLQKD